MGDPMSSPGQTTVDPAEIERFSRIAAEWWDPAGKFAPLHRLNPLRIRYIRDRAAAHWQRDALSGAQFDIVLALEIVEHVADVDLFLKSCGRMVKPGGLLFLSTLNRTPKAWALAIAGAEYILGWLPRGTHDWKKFLKPSEVVNGLRAGGIEAQEIVGVVYSPLSRAWSLNKSDLDVNYMLYGSRLVR